MIKINTQRNGQNGEAPKHIVHRKAQLSEPANGTGFLKHFVNVSYEILPKSEAETLSNESTEAFLQRVITGWGDPKTGKGGFADENGEPLDFNNEEHKNAVYDTPWISAGLVSDYFKTAYGVQKGN